MQCQLYNVYWYSQFRWSSSHEPIKTISEIFYLIEGFVAGTLDSKVDHGVGEGATHVELQGQVVHPLHRGQLVPYGTVRIPL